jgi:hypothetical protein
MPDNGIVTMVIIGVFIGAAMVGSAWMWVETHRLRKRMRADNDAAYSKALGKANIFTTPAPTNATPSQTNATPSCTSYSEMASTAASPANTSLADPVDPTIPLEYDFSKVDRHTRSKTLDIVGHYKDAHISGFVVSLGYHGVTHAVIDRSAVRWLKNKEFWDVMHPVLVDLPTSKSPPSADN